MTHSIRQDSTLCSTIEVTYIDTARSMALSLLLFLARRQRVVPKLTSPAIDMVASSSARGFERAVHLRHPFVARHTRRDKAMKDYAPLVPGSASPSKNFEARCPVAVFALAALLSHAGCRARALNAERPWAVVGLLRQRRKKEAGSLHCYRWHTPRCGGSC